MGLALCGESDQSNETVKKVDRCHSLATGLLYLITNFHERMYPIATPIFITFSSTTLFVNWVVTVLVVLRLLHFRRRVIMTLGDTYSKPYAGIISMCVESAALVIIFSTIFLVLNLLYKLPFSSSRTILIQIYVSHYILKFHVHR